MKNLFIICFLLLSFNVEAALSNSVCASLVVTEIKTINTGLTGAAEAEAITFWTAICKGLLTHIKTSADINLGAGDIVVPGLGLLDSFALPVTGAAASSAVILPGKIQ